MTLLSVQEARERILSHLEPVEALRLPLAAAASRVLAEDVIAPSDLPLFDNSSVDGFALIATDLADASPAAARSLRVVADIPAGISPSATVGPGQAARIMTGAPLPPGADTVIAVEDTDFDHRGAGQPAPAIVRVRHPVERGENVRRRGEDVQRGQKVLAAGQRLRPAEIGLLAMLGIAEPMVYRQPRVALLSTGDELIPVEAPLEAGKVRDANTYMLAALITESGAELLPLGIARDRREQVRERLEKAIEGRAELIVSSAGVSVGAFDFVREVVEAQGSLDFWRVNMRPGKPLAFGQYRGVPFIGLPGNPVSAFVGFEVFVRPAIGRLGGSGNESRPRLRVRLAEPISADGRESYLRAVLGETNGVYVARLSGHQGSGNLFSLVQANALLIIPAGVKSLATETEVDAWLLP